MSVLPNLIFRFSVMPVSYFVDINKIILKFYYKTVYKRVCLMKKFQSTFISKADKSTKIIILENFETTKAYLSKCQENILRK